MLTPEIVYGVGAVLLAGGIAWGLVRYYTRNRANDPITEEATRELRENPRAYAEHGREDLKAQLKPDNS